MSMFDGAMGGLLIVNEKTKLNEILKWYGLRISVRLGMSQT
jgi:hypothetical protein